LYSTEELPFIEIILLTMGNKPQAPSEKPFDMSTIHKEYTPAFEKYQANPNFFGNKDYI
jgi:hypothetical protein